MYDDRVAVVVGAAYYTEILQNEFILTHYYAVKHVIHYATKIQSVMAQSSLLELCLWLKLSFFWAEEAQRDP